MPSAKRQSAAESHRILPRGSSRGASAGRLLAPGLFTRLPDPTGSVVVREVLLPDTVAGPHRHYTGFRVPHSRQVVNANLRRPILRGKRARDAVLQFGAFACVRVT